VKPKPQPFRLFSHDEFAGLTKDEKIAYLARAIEAITHGAPVLSIVRRDATGQISKPH
jgi:hypothetical protein